MGFYELSALLCEQLLPIQQWSSERINQILLEGDRLFLNALRSRQIPDKEAFCLSKLPIFACWSSQTKGRVQNSSIVEASSPIEAKSNPLWRSVLIYPLWWSPLRQNTIRPLSQNIIRPFRQIIQLSLRQNIIRPLRQNIIRPLRQKQTSGPRWSPLSLNIILLLRQNIMLLLLYM